MPEDVRTRCQLFQPSGAGTPQGGVCIILQLVLQLQPYWQGGTGSMPFVNTCSVLKGVVPTNSPCLVRWCRRLTWSSTSSKGESLIPGTTCSSGQATG
jgi:hypothetical protein